MEFIFVCAKGAVILAAMASEVAEHRGNFEANRSFGVNVEDPALSNMFCSPVFSSEPRHQSGYLGRTRNFIPPYPRVDLCCSNIEGGNDFTDFEVESPKCVMGGLTDEDYCVARLAEQMAHSMLNDEQETEDIRGMQSDTLLGSDSAYWDGIFGHSAHVDLPNLDSVEDVWLDGMVNRTRKSNSCGAASLESSGIVNHTRRSNSCGAASLESSNMSNICFSTEDRAPKTPSFLGNNLCTGSKRCCFESSAVRGRKSYTAPAEPDAGASQSTFQRGCDVRDISSLQAQPLNNYVEGKLSSNQQQSYRQLSTPKPTLVNRFPRSNSEIRRSQKQPGACNRPSQFASTLRHAQSSVGVSGMRAVFLGAKGSTESVGTGVFLPRSRGSGSESKRSSAFSTVLLPSRIVQILKLQVEDVKSLAVRGASESGPMLDVSTKDFTVNDSKYVGVRALTPAEKYSVKSCTHLSSIEARLPTEWTY